jgi:hypothetical protein
MSIVPIRGSFTPPYNGTPFSYASYLVIPDSTVCPLVKECFCVTDISLISSGEITPNCRYSTRRSRAFENENMSVELMAASWKRNGY